MSTTDDRTATDMRTQPGANGAALDPRPAPASRPLRPASPPRSSAPPHTVPPSPIPLGIRVELARIAAELARIAGTLAKIAHAGEDPREDPARNT